MKKRLTDFFDTLVTLPILGLLYVISVMPDTLAYRICMALGSMARVLRIRYRVVDNNLQIAFPQMARQERVRLIKKVYANFGRLTGEWLSARKNMQTLEKKVRCVGVEEFPKALQEGRGIIVCSAHFGH